MHGEHGFNRDGQERGQERGVSTRAPNTLDHCPSGRTGCPCDVSVLPDSECLI